ncbi:MAG: DUF3467 domain-containing protein [Bryobacteraceae bacterium]|jgi:hypothetical protein
MEQHPNATVPEQPLNFRRTSDFRRAYANNIQFESSIWDLVMVFGQVIQNPPDAPGKMIVDQHTAITISWPEVKLLKHYLEVAILGHEAEDGRIPLSPRALPEALPTDEQRPDMLAMHTTINRMRLDLLNKSVPEFVAPPAVPED